MPVNSDWFIQYFQNIIQRNVSPAAFGWLLEKTIQFGGDKGSSIFYSSFTAVPRQTGKLTLTLTESEIRELSENVEGFSLRGYTVDRLVRVWILLKWPSENKDAYLRTISQLFKAAEMNELVALYSALPLLQYPEDWVKQCAEGVRSNIGTVLEALICNNPYPSKYLEEAAWNQLVMKAFFTDKPANKIIGLDERSNKALAYTLSDYAHERWAAGRSVDPQLWRLVGKFIDERTFPDLQRVFSEGDLIDKQAVALTFAKTDYKPAKVLLDGEPDLKSAVENGQLTWDKIADASLTHTI